MTDTLNPLEAAKARQVKVAEENLALYLDALNAAKQAEDEARERHARELKVLAATTKDIQREVWAAQKQLDVARNPPKRKLKVRPI